MLDRLSDDMDRTLQAVRKAEQKLNQQCKDQVDELGDRQRVLQEVQDEFNAKSETISELTNALSSVSDELGKIKGKMDERGNSMTDTSPLIKIKSALTQLRAESKQIDIRIGVATHSLVAKKLKSDASTKREAAIPKNTHLQDENFVDDDEVDIN